MATATRREPQASDSAMTGVGIVVGDGQVIECVVPDERSPAELSADGQTIGIVGAFLAAGDLSAAAVKRPARPGT